METVTLTRISDDGKQTLGTLGVRGNPPFFAKTLELAWKDNQSNQSCIPKGEYICKYTRSNRISKLRLNRWLKNNPGKTEADCPEEVKNAYTYEVLNVKGRSGIRIHPANYFFDLLGCIALGSEHKKLNVDEQLDLIHSGDTVAKFDAYMNYKDFKLVIR